jgi:hypothetical protein
MNNISKYSITAAAILAIAGAAHGAAVTVNTDSSTEGIADALALQNPVAAGYYELGWLAPGTTSGQIFSLFSAGDLAGIDALFTTVVAFPWNNSTDDGSTNSYGDGLVFNSTPVVSDHITDAAGFAAYKANHAGKQMVAWIRDAASLGATTKMALVVGIPSMIFPVANDVLGFTDFEGNFATDSSLIGPANVWVGTIEAIQLGGGMDIANGGAADGAGEFGGTRVLELATVVPEPSAALLTLVGLAGFALRRRRS